MQPSHLQAVQGELLCRLLWMQTLLTLHHLTHAWCVLQLPTQVIKGVLEGSAPEQLSPELKHQLAHYSQQPGSSAGVPQATLQLLQGLTEAPT